MKTRLMRWIYQLATLWFVPTRLSLYLYTGLPFGLSALRYAEESTIESPVLELINPIGSCPECDGFGVHFDGRKCQYCKGSGNVWWSEFSVKLPPDNRPSA